MKSGFGALLDLLQTFPDEVYHYDDDDDDNNNRSYSEKLTQPKKDSVVPLLLVEQTLSPAPPFRRSFPPLWRYNRWCLVVLEHHLSSSILLGRSCAFLQSLYRSRPFPTLHRLKGNYAPTPAVSHCTQK